jgi:hypothetical protein
MPTSRTGYSLLDYSTPQSLLFQPSKSYVKPAHRPFGLPPLAPQEPIPGISTSGGATPMPDRISSSTPAWDPLSRTPRYSQFLIPTSVNQNLLLAKFTGPWTHRPLRLLGILLRISLLLPIAKSLISSQTGHNTIF